MKPSESDLERGRAYAEDERLSAFYERHLLENCSYRAPAELAEVVAPLARPDSTWLDLGAGTGLVGKALDARGVSVQLVAADISAAMLDRIDCPLYISRIRTDCRERLPWRKASFAGATACGLLEHIEDAQPL